MPVLTFLEPIQSPDVDARALSLGAGIICHILADTVFHPLVYYHSGMSRVHPGATARHRRFETALDLYFLHLAGPGFRTCLGRILSQTEVTQENLLRHLGRLFSLENRETVPAWDMRSGPMCFIRPCFKTAACTGCCHI